MSTKCWARGRCARACKWRHRRGLTRFVGRQSELEQLQRALDQAKAGHGQIVGVMGEPGLGKSRLFYEFKLLSQVAVWCWKPTRSRTAKRRPICR